MIVNEKLAKGSKIPDFPKYDKVYIPEFENKLVLYVVRALVSKLFPTTLQREATRRWNKLALYSTISWSVTQGLWNNIDINKQRQNCWPPVQHSVKRTSEEICSQISHVEVEMEGPVDIVIIKIY